MPTYQWFPGHMAKARREITEVLPLVDIVIELRDSRIPMSSKNPMIDDICKNKPRLILLTKALVSDKIETKKWIEALKGENQMALDVDSISGYNIKEIIPSIKEVLKDKLLSYKKRGLVNKTLRAIVVGIPNVGKSTLINTLAKKKVCKTGDKPGVTKSLTWLKITNELQILDTPGVLWPKFESQDVGVRLTICSGIKDEIVDLNHTVLYALNYLNKEYPKLLKERYNLTDDEVNEDTPELDILKLIALKRGCLLKGGELDLDRAINLILYDLRNEKIGAVTFEKASEYIS